MRTGANLTHLFIYAKAVVNYKVCFSFTLAQVHPTMPCILLVSYVTNEVVTFVITKANGCNQHGAPL